MSIAKGRSEVSHAGLIVNERVTNLLLEKKGILSFLSSEGFQLMREVSRPYFPSLGIIGFGSLVLSFLKTAESVFIIALISLVLGDSVPGGKIVLGGIEVPFPFGGSSPLIMIAGGVGVLLALNSVGSYALSRMSFKTQSLLMGDLRMRFSSKMFWKNISYFTDNKVSEILNIIQTIMNRFSRMISSVQTFLVSILTALFNFVLMYKLSAFLTLLMSVFVGLVYLFQRLIRTRNVRLSYQFEEAQTRFLGDFMNYVYGIRLIKQSGREAWILKDIKGSLDKMEEASVRSALYAVRAGVLTEFGLVAGLLLFFLSFKLVDPTQQHWTKEILLPFFFLSYRMIKDVRVSFGLQHELDVMYPHVVIVNEVLKDPMGDPVKKPSPIGFGKSSDRDGVWIDHIQKITVEGVRFSYDQKREILKGVNLEFKIGTSTAIVGMSGSGKSTLLDLLARVRAPQSGKILINQTDITLLESSRFFSKFGYASQETVLFNQSILENLKFCNDDFTPDALRKSLEDSCVIDFMNELPQGLDTIVGERGLKLSGGQRQRLNLARVLVGNPEVLLLDEATNALDLSTERRVYERLLKSKKDRVLIVAAHRLSAVQEFDQIIVMNLGKMVEQGTHPELIAAKGIYYSLFEIQKHEGLGI